MDLTPSQRKELMTRIAGLAGLVLVVVSLGLSMFTLKVHTTDSGDRFGGAVTLTPFGPETKSSDLTPALVEEMPFDVDGLHATASWFAPAVGDGMDYTARQGGPDLEGELTAVRIGMVMLLVGTAAALAIAVGWMFLGLEQWTKPIAIALIVAGGLVLVGWVIQLAGMAAMAGDSGDFVEEESGGGMDADVGVGAALFLVPLGAIALVAGGIRGLLPEGSDRGPRQRSDTVGF